MSKKGILYKIYDKNNVVNFVVVGSFNHTKTDVLYLWKKKMKDVLIWAKSAKIMILEEVANKSIEEVVELAEERFMKIIHEVSDIPTEIKILLLPEGIPKFVVYMTYLRLFMGFNCEKTTWSVAKFYDLTLLKEFAAFCGPYGKKGVESCLRCFEILTDAQKRSISEIV